MTLTLVVGLVGLCFVMLYLMNSLDEKHWVMKLLILFFVVSTILLIPKAAIDSTTACELVIDNITDAPSTVHTYLYRTECYSTTNSTTGTSFLEITQLMYYLFIGYAIVALAVWAMMKMYESVKQRGGGR